MSDVKMEYGWRLLRDGEIVAAGDEVLDESIGTPWFKTNCAGAKHDRLNCPRRRKIDPGEGFKLMPEHFFSDLMKAFYVPGCEWTADGLNWARNLTAENVLAYRCRQVDDKRASNEPERKPSHPISDWESLCQQLKASKKLAGAMLAEVDQLRPLLGYGRNALPENAIMTARVLIETLRAHLQSVQTPQLCPGCNDTARKLDAAERKLAAVAVALSAQSKGGQ